MTQPLPDPRIQELLAREEKKRQQWDFENALRRHNHLGLVVGLLSALAKKDVETGDGSWERIKNGAREKMQERIRAARERRKAGASGEMEIDS